MGSRANYAIVSDGTWELRYSHWGANGLAEDLLPGPEAATRFVREQRVVDHWLDDVWGEAAALIDLDQRRLLFFAIDFDGFADRKAILNVLERTWPGWRVGWAYDGIADLVSYVDGDRALVRRHDPDGIGAPSPASEDYIPCLVTVAAGGSVRAHAVDIEASEVLDHGADIAAGLGADTAIERCHAFPESGVHVDLIGRSVQIWATNPLNGALERLAGTWPGWWWEFHEDRYAEQAVRAAVTFPELDMASAYARLRERVVRHRADDPLSAARGLIDHLSGSDESFTVSPYLFDHRAVPPSGAEEGRLAAVIDGLAEGR